jgi:prepilin-type N-terminal cleavage/methylation domain-containing protein
VATNRSGFTLIETLLAAALFSLLATLALSVIVPMVQAGQRGTDESDLHQMAALTLELLAEDIEQSAAPGLVLTANVNSQVPLAFSVQQVIGVNPSGSTIWSGNVNVYCWNQSQQQIRVLSCPPTPVGVTTVITETAPCRWTSHDLGILVLPTGGSRFLTSNVKSFSIAGPTAHGLQEPVRLSLSLQRLTGNVLQSVTVQQSASPTVHDTH